MSKERESLFPLTDANGDAPIRGYRCHPDCLAYQGYGHHVGCEEVMMEPLAELVRVYCLHCCKTHTVRPDEEQCAPEAWLFAGESWPTDSEARRA